MTKWLEYSWLYVQVSANLGIRFVEWLSQRVLTFAWECNTTATIQQFLGWFVSVKAIVQESSPLLSTSMEVNSVDPHFPHFFFV